MYSLFLFPSDRVSTERHNFFPTTNMNAHRVAIVGAGAAGLSAAYALSRHPDKFIVTVFEKEPVTGGMASSMDIDSTLCDASYINDGVQGCSPAFANTLRIFRELRYPPEKVDMQCASCAHLSCILLPHYSSTFVTPFTLTELVLVKAKTFGPTSFLLPSHSASPLTSVNLGASSILLSFSRLCLHCSPYMCFYASLDYPRISGRGWCILSLRSSLAPGTRRRMWPLSFW